MATDPLDADGTQALPALSFLADPLAGLVTGDTWSSHEPKMAGPKPVTLPDPTDIRAALEEEPRRPVRKPLPTVTTQPAMPPPIRPWPSPAAMAKALRATRDRLPTPKLDGRSSSRTTGLAVVAVILLVTVVILVFVVRSLADTFGQLFG